MAGPDVLAGRSAGPRVGPSPGAVPVGPDDHRRGWLRVRGEVLERRLPALSRHPVRPPAADLPALSRGIRVFRHRRHLDPVVRRAVQRRDGGRGLPALPPDPFRPRGPDRCRDVRSVRHEPEHRGLHRQRRALHAAAAGRLRPSHLRPAMVPCRSGRRRRGALQAEWCGGVRADRCVGADGGSSAAPLVAARRTRCRSRLAAVGGTRNVDRRGALLGVDRTAPRPVQRGDRRSLDPVDRDAQWIRAHAARLDVPHSRCRPRRCASCRTRAQLRGDLAADLADRRRGRRLVAPALLHAADSTPVPDGQRWTACLVLRAASDRMGGSRSPSPSCRSSSAICD